MRVNGNFYHNAGQGYAIEKSKSAEGSKTEVPEHGAQSSDEPIMVHHVGGGKFKTKTKSGKTADHESSEAMHAHLDQHFGTGGDEPEGHDSSDEDMSEDSGEALSSILG
jgi:hypothetical protein